MEYINIFVQSIGHYPYLFVLITFTLMLFLVPVPEEIIIFTGGYLSSSLGGTVWIPTIIACIAGMFYTDFWFYILAKIFGKKFINSYFGKRVLPKRRRRKLFLFVNKFGAWAVFIIRFVPGGFRNPTFVVCGISNLPVKKFIMASITGASIVVNVSFWSGFYLSNKLPPVNELLSIIESKVYIIAGITSVSLILAYYIRKNIKKKRRLERLKRIGQRSS